MNLFSAQEETQRVGVLDDIFCINGGQGFICRADRQDNTENIFEDLQELLNLLTKTFLTL